MHRFFANQALTHSHKTKSQISSNCLLASFVLLVLSCLASSNLYSYESNNHIEKDVENQLDQKFFFGHLMQ